MPHDPEFELLYYYEKMLSFDNFRRGILLFEISFESSLELSYKFSNISFIKPKSPILIYKFSKMKIFDGFISLWTVYNS